MEEVETRIDEFLEERVRKDNEEQDNGEKQESQTRSPGIGATDAAASTATGATEAKEPVSPPGDGGDTLPELEKDTDDEGEHKDKSQKE